jgi:hypothetical protein
LQETEITIINQNSYCLVRINGFLKGSFAVEGALEGQKLAIEHSPGSRDEEARTHRIVCSNHGVSAQQASHPKIISKLP